MTAWATEALPMSYGTTRRGGRPLRGSVFNTCSIRWSYFRRPSAGILSGTLHCIGTDVLLWKCYQGDIFMIYSREIHLRTILCRSSWQWRQWAVLHWPELQNHRPCG
jgi:hypothetical protein